MASYYTLQSISDNEIRAFFLSDKASSEALLARMLPFVEKKPPVELEVATGLEPVNNGFADRRRNHLATPP